MTDATTLGTITTTTSLEEHRLQEHRLQEHRLLLMLTAHYQNYLAWKRMDQAHVNTVFRVLPACPQRTFASDLYQRTEK